MAGSVSMISSTTRSSEMPWILAWSAICLSPLVEKQIADQARIHGISEDRVVEEIMLTEPAIKRLIEPAEVAELVAYLCSAPASFANGSSYVLDGGWSAR